ncbi:phosphonate C-P lyase system protein PhnH [Agrobacterium sp. rho-13.3]|uniref:phosphonate C-P lyase system protein PhnH n=1 Tax=Agrobacterium sp. rho-13.3 TaxID=3072980 RepID=UPI002A132C96|nr:phosphonate C-P lyase system protein PhnH [Agrobacterium sp. rho-13.3]MDX8309774.1 phosphonate C-P lyase system protein PhnH [Agrobacterium sp. rho-13.3]
MPTKAAIVSGGFSDAVFQSQQVFKTVMDGMARPGTLKSIDLSINPPAPLGHATGGILLTLCDHDTPVWLSAPLAKSIVAGWLAFHTGAPVAEAKTEARFAVIEPGSGLSSFDLFAQGTQDYPDRSATVIIGVTDFETGPQMVLSGPGIRHTETIRPSGLPEIFERLWNENRAVFPRGVDVILTCGNRLICLPRTTRIEVMGS